MRLLFHLNKERFTPVLSVILILSLAVGIATSIFCLINSILITSLPFKDADRLIYLRESNDSAGMYNSPASFDNYRDWKRQSEYLEELSAMRESLFILVGHGDPQPIVGAYVDEDFFKIFGMQLRAGRMPQGGERDVVIIGHRLWKSALGGDESAIGTDVKLNKDTYKIIGIANSSFDTSSFISTLLWIPLEADPDYGWERGTRTLRVIGKLKQGVTIRQAESEFLTIAGRLENAYPVSNTGWSVRVDSLLSWVVSGSTKRGLLLLGGVAIFAIFIAWLNMIILLVSIGLSKRRELAIRSALGATPGKLSLMLARDIILPCLLASSLGLLISYWILVLLRHLDPGVPRLQEVSFGWSALVIVVFLTILTTGVATIFARRLTQTEFASALKNNNGGFAQSGRMNNKNIIPVLEIALALILVAVTLSSLEDLIRLQKGDLGINIKDIYQAKIQFSSNRYSSDEEKVNFFHALESRLEQIPFLENSGFTTTLPLDERAETMEVFSFPQDQKISTRFQQVTPSYFRVMGMKLIAGRFLNDGDRLLPSRAVLVNQALARILMEKDRTIIGEKINAETEFDQKIMDFEIVGVVNNVKQNGPLRKVHPEIYFPYERIPRANITLIIQSNVGGNQIAQSTRDVVGELDHDIVIYKFGFLDELYNMRFLSQPMFGFITLALFAILAIGSALGGLYGTITYQVNLRKREIGIRMALGADRAQIFRLVLGWGFKISIIGMLIGILIVILLTTFVSSILIDTEAADWHILSAASMLLILITIAIIIRPAGKAASVQPIEVIKNLQ